MQTAQVIKRNSGISQSFITYEKQKNKKYFVNANKIVKYFIKIAFPINIYIYIYVYVYIYICICIYILERDYYF
jgi:hypothetical protein